MTEEGIMGHGFGVRAQRECRPTGFSFLEFEHRGHSGESLTVKVTWQLPTTWMFVA